jgi:hypothetical protein
MKDHSVYVEQGRLALQELRDLPTGSRQLFHVRGAQVHDVLAHAADHGVRVTPCSVRQAAWY